MLDPTNELTIATLQAPLSHATNNAGSAGVDLRDFVGRVAVRLNVGLPTIGDNDRTFTVKLQSSADNTAANATDLSVSNLVVTNNNTGAATIAVDTRVAQRYLHSRVIIAGTNSPAYPFSASVIGRKQVQ